MKSSRVVVLVCGMLVGCGATVSQLKSRAAFDLHCDEASLQIIDIDPRTKGVRGCGQQATYVETCSNPNNGTGCTWVLNADARPQ